MCPAAQNLGERIGEGPWLRELEDVIVLSVMAYHSFGGEVEAYQLVAWAHDRNAAGLEVDHQLQNSGQRCGRLDCRALVSSGLFT